MPNIFSPAPISRDFYTRDTLIVARELLGMYIVRQLATTQLIARIVETECYRTHDDPACHGYNRLTPRTQALYGPPGHAYIYFIYGNHYCFNTVAHEPDQAGGVLIRAVEPILGIEDMQKLRKSSTIKQLTNGPGKLAQAFAINRALYGIDLTKTGELYIAYGEKVDDADTQATSRIGISVALEKQWRFYIKNNPFVSR